MSLTIIYITANHISEYFAENVRTQLKKAAKDYPIISVSHKPIDLGENICVGDIGRNKINIYKQILIGAKAAKTDYVAIAEDDVLYSEDHFKCFRPEMDTFAYNMNRWSLYTWRKDRLFALKQRQTNTNLIAPRQLLIDTLEERFAKYPEISSEKINRHWSEPGKYEKHLGLTERKTCRFNSYQPIIIFSHSEALGYKNLGKRKRLDPIRAIELPYFGRAEDLIKLYEKDK